MNEIKKIVVNTQFGMTTSDVEVLEIVPTDNVTIEVELDGDIDEEIEKILEDELKEQEPSAWAIAEDILDLIAEKGVVIR